MTRLSDQHRLAYGLGVFSIALGVAELAAPRLVARLIGLSRAPATVVQLCGLRELASGIGIVSRRRPTGAVWSRVAGDAMDVALLGAAFAVPRSDRAKLSVAAAAVLGVTALDVLCGRALSARDGAARIGDVHTRRSVTISAFPEELYTFWRDFENLPTFMEGLHAVHVQDERRSHWEAKGPVGSRIEWDAEILDDRPNERIAWRTVAGSMIEHAGEVRFIPTGGGRGTVVTVDMRYRLPGGMIGAAVAKLIGEEPGARIQQDLRRFKQFIETGEITLSDATLYGTGFREQRPARPAGITAQRDAIQAERTQQ